MLQRNLNQLITLSLLLLLAACSTDEEPPAPTPNPPVSEEPVLPTDPLAAQLESRLRDQVMGFAYVILRNGEVAVKGGGGLARNDTDGRLPMSTDLPMHIASISKWVTTVATLSLLERHEISFDEPVAPYFPADWVLGPGISSLSFMDLLAQRGGFNQYGSNSFNANQYDSLKQIVQNGAEAIRVKLYNNNHHALFRVILPVLRDQIEAREAQYTPVTTGLAYEEIVQTLLFDPYQIEADLTASSVSQLIRAYADKSDTGQGLGLQLDFTQVGGAYGWHISADDLAEIWRAAWYTEVLINEETRAAMTSNTAGLFETRDGTHGRYYMKDGAWWYSNEPQRQLQTIAAHFPDATDVIIYINSALDSNGWLGSLVIQAYEDSRLPG